MDPTATKIKFCGITSAADAADAVAAGAWALGVILWSGSPRRCRLDVAAEIAAAHKRQVELVGVFVNPTLDQVARAADTAGLTMLQFHGEEGPVFCGEAARRTGCRVIKAARVRSGADIQATFAWELAKAHGGRVPLILSGGLSAANVAHAITAVRPFAVDVASGVESAPGRKDPGKLEAFAAAVAPSAVAASTT
jgi:phosphoribosylanthranilate isomerase